GVAGVLGLQSLQRHATVQLGVLGEVDFTDPPLGVEPQGPVALSVGGGARQCGRSAGGGGGGVRRGGGGEGLEALQAPGTAGFLGEGVGGVGPADGGQQGVETGVELLHAGQAVGTAVHVGGDGFQVRAGQTAGDEGS